MVMYNKHECDAQCILLLLLAKRLVEALAHLLHLLVRRQQLYNVDE